MGDRALCSRIWVSELRRLTYFVSIKGKGYICEARFKSQLQQCKSVPGCLKLAGNCEGWDWHRGVPLSICRICISGEEILHSPHPPPSIDARLELLNSCPFISLSKHRGALSMQNLSLHDQCLWVWRGSLPPLLAEVGRRRPAEDAWDLFCVSSGHTRCPDPEVFIILLITPHPHCCSLLAAQ